MNPSIIAPIHFSLSVLSWLHNKTIPHDDQKTVPKQQKQFKATIQDMEDEEDTASQCMSTIRDEWLLPKLANTPKTHEPHYETPAPELENEGGQKAQFYVNLKGKTINWSEEAIIPQSNQLAHGQWEQLWDPSKAAITSPQPTPAS